MLQRKGPSGKPSGHSATKPSGRVHSAASHLCACPCMGRRTSKPAKPRFTLNKQVQVRVRLGHLQSHPNDVSESSHIVLRVSHDTYTSHCFKSSDGAACETTRNSVHISGPQATPQGEIPPHIGNARGDGEPTRRVVGGQGTSLQSRNRATSEFTARPDAKLVATVPLAQPSACAPTLPPPAVLVPPCPCHRPTTRSRATTDEIASRSSSCAR